MYWSPFAHLRETQKYPLSRLLRASLWGRFKDTFKVFYGSFLTCDMGILDYLFPLPRLFQNSCHALDELKPEHPLIKGAVNSAFIISVILTFLLSLPKFLVALLLTIIVMPVVIPVHFGIRKMNPWLKEIPALKLRGITYLRSTKEDFEKIIFDDKPLHLLKKIQSIAEKFFWRDTQSIDDIEDEYLIKPIYKSAINEEGTHFSSHPKTGEFALGLFHKNTYSCFSPATAGGLLGVINLTSENRIAIKAILETNSFQATENLENSQLLHSVENYLIQSN